MKAIQNRTIHELCKSNWSVMKNALILLALFISILSCNNDDEVTGVIDRTDPTNSVIYQLEGTTNSNITGEVTFARNHDNTSTVFVRLVGASEGIHPTAIHFNSKEEGGSQAIRLNTCICLESETMVAQLDDGTSINFDELIDFDGHLNIFESEVLSEIIIAQTNIGSNAQ